MPPRIFGSITGALENVLAQLHRPEHDHLKTFPENSDYRGNLIVTSSINIGNFESFPNTPFRGSRRSATSVGIHMQRAYETENALMVKAFANLRSDGELSDELKDALVKAFGERFTNGWKLAKSRKVRRYEFTPSGRVVWAVQGRKGEYQVMPDVPFCYCDDYYFRVMEKKRGLCYHIIAQRVAESLNQFVKISKKDAQYSTITDRWRAKDKEIESE